MKIYVFYKPLTGMVVQSMSFPDTVDPNAVAQQLDLSALQITQDQAAELRVNAYVKDGVLYNPGHTPPGMDFDVVSKAFVPNFAALRADKLGKVENQFVFRSQLPIMYDGHMFDASIPTQATLVRKLTAQTARASRGAPTPASQLVWYDVDGAAITFPSHVQFKNWLEDLMIAIDDRTAELMVWKHSKRTALFALGDNKAAIESFDPLS